MKFSWFLVLCTFVISSCGNLSPIPTATSVPSEIAPSLSATPDSKISAAAATYLNDALDIMQKYSINKHKIDWLTFRSSILGLAKNAQSTEDTYPYIKYALTELNDNHSHFEDAQVASASAAASIPFNPTDVKMLENRIGYVHLPAYLASNADGVRQYGSDMQQAIAKVDALQPCGWIVDLRGNAGGSIGPMLLGVGPILGEGKAGSWIDADGNQLTWSYDAGQLMIGNHIAANIIGKPYYLSKPNPPVAVLFGGQTLSAGEVVVVSFIGRPNTRSFGDSSGGQSSAINGYPLSDGAVIGLTVANDMDRLGNEYGGKIKPDVVVSFETDSNIPGAIPNEAIQWLQAQSACVNSQH
jgi:carboxyl-terminal processing protease